MDVHVLATATWVASTDWIAQRVFAMQQACFRVWGYFNSGPRIYSSLIHYLITIP
jgi:hypothetical protein